ncbi:ankyrin repeat-containing domain protein [Mycena galericulata]|nr:ankyrin repeat-containing domain protein [Mycena galericulata]
MGNTEVVRLLLKNGANGNTAGREFGRPLKAAIIKLLLDDGADVNAVGGKYGGVLPAACAGGTREIAQLVLDKEADVAAAAPIPGKLPHAKVTSWFMAHQTEVLSLLLANGADANSTGGKYGSPLCAASSGGHHELVVILLDHGADVNKCGIFGSAVQAAAGPLRLKRMQRLVWLEERKELLVRRIKTVETLLDKGANVDSAGGKRGTALQLASRWGHADIAQVLLKKGANIDANFGKGGTALQIAAR